MAASAFLAISGGVAMICFTSVCNRSPNIHCRLLLYSPLAISKK
jgi:hypothetical protein